MGVFWFMVIEDRTSSAGQNPKPSLQENEIIPYRWLECQGDERWGGEIHFHAHAPVIRSGHRLPLWGESHRQRILDYPCTWDQHRIPPNGRYRLTGDRHFPHLDHPFTIWVGTHILTVGTNATHSEMSIASPCWQFMRQPSSRMMRGKTHST